MHDPLTPSHKSLRAEDKSLKVLINVDTASVPFSICFLMCCSTVGVEVIKTCPFKSPAPSP